MATSARDQHLEHVIWSTLEDTRKWMSLDDERIPTLQGKYNGGAPTASSAILGIPLACLPDGNTS